MRLLCLGAHAQARYTVVCLHVHVCVCVSVQTSAKTFRVGRACALKQQKVHKQDCGLTPDYSWSMQKYYMHIWAGACSIFACSN